MNRSVYCRNLANTSTGWPRFRLGWAGDTGKGRRRMSRPRTSELREDVGGQAAGEACAIWLHIQGLHYTIIYHHGEPARKRAGPVTTA